jgi:uncharacterized membrane protein
MENFAETLMLPIILILFGIFLGIAGRPRKIRWWIGYRTSRAMKNQETWELANSYSGKLIMLSGFTALTFCIGAFVYNDFMELVHWAWGAQGVALIMSIILTEMALRKEFDKNGNKKR